MVYSNNSKIIQSQFNKIEIMKKVIKELENKSRKNNNKNIDSIQIFVEEKCKRPSHDSNIKLSDFYEIYKKWCQSKKDMFIFSSVSFRYYLENTLAFRIERVSSDGCFYIKDTSIHKGE